jgi:cytosine/adenosine deaminase-related metal-dependent hydrolase
MLPENNVLVCSDAGIVIEIIDEADAGEDMEFHAGIISPGFINAHCHIELSHLKNLIPKHTGLVNFVQMIMSNRDANSDQKQGAMELASRELEASGTVAVGDICNGADSLSLKRASSLYWHNFIEVSGFVDAGAEMRIENATKILMLFEEAGLHSSITPHAPYSVSGNLFRMINGRSVDGLISIHNQETAAEDELYVSKTGAFLNLYENFGINISSFTPSGKRSLASWLPYFDKNQSILLVHNTFTTQRDISLSSFNKKHRQLYFCLCPNANLYIENCLPPVELLMENHVELVIGTDSYASNDQLDIMAEIRTISSNFPGIELATMLRWATLNGAKALNIADVYGSFETGKQPGVVVVKNLHAKRIL